MTCCVYILFGEVLLCIELHPYVIINTAHPKKTSTHHDGNITGNQQISSHNDKINTPVVPQYTMTKLQNIKTLLQDQRNKDYIRKLCLSIHWNLEKRLCNQFHPISPVFMSYENEINVVLTLLECSFYV